MKNIVASNPFYDFWFKETSIEIYIVCQRVSIPPNDAYKYSNDYAYNDNLGDKDALFYAYALLYRNYPTANIQIYYAEDFMEKVRNWEKKNILIIGGPNSKNPVCQFFTYEVLPNIHKKLKKGLPRYMFPPKYQHELKPNENQNYCKEVICKGCPKIKSCERLALCIKNDTDVALIFPEVGDEIIVPETEIKLNDNLNTEIVKDENNKLRISAFVKKDIGIFATFQNPFDENQHNQIVMISGVYTFGVVGTCQAMSASSRLSINNYNDLYFEFIDNRTRDFIAYFEIDINKQREVRYSILDMNNIISFSEKIPDNEISNVFISYRRKNGKDSANKIFDLLESNRDKKIYPFIDLKLNNSTFTPGIDYVKDIQGKISQCDIFLSIISSDCFITDAGAEGGYKAEWFWAVKTGQAIIPVECGASYYDELNKIKEEIITFFGEDVFKELSRLNAVPINQDNIVETIEQKLKHHYR